MDYKKEMHDQFCKVVFEHALKRMSVEFALDELENGLIRDIVEECFLLQGFDELAKEGKAELILSILLGIFVRGFNFEAFLKEIPEDTRANFLSTLLFQIYYRNFSLKYLSSPKILRFYLLQMAALYDDDEEYVQFCREHYNEGSYAVLQESEDQELTQPKEHYREGLGLITFALPTKGKELSHYAWIPSVTKAIQKLCDKLGIENTIPIYVYDQSEPELFAKNSAYIKSVSKNIVHISSEEMLKRAKVRGVEALISPGGYGPARNALFLLLDANILHMGDDDVHVPFSAISADALFAYTHKDEYFTKFAWVKGRKTVWTEASFNLEYILEHTRDILLQHAWQDKPFRHGMAGLLTKPKICLNIPFGQEEAHMRAIKEYTSDLAEPLLHLSGDRFPKVTIPTNRFSGLADFLRAQYRYAIGAMLVSDLIDPLDRFGRCSLPWNRRKEPFNSFEEAMECIVGADMLQPFEKNILAMKEEFATYNPNKESTFALYHLGVLEHQDVDAILKPYSRFPKEMAELKALFSELAEDFASFKAVLAGKKAESHLFMTQSLELLINFFRSHSFQNAVREIKE